MNEESEQSRHILVIDDDAAMRQMIVTYLEENYMNAVPCSGRGDMVRQFARKEPSLVILNLVLGREDGLELLREIKSNSKIPVIIVTGQRSSAIDPAVGLELGADDYLTKPFSLRELLARIRAVLRRGPIEQTTPDEDRARGRCRFCGWRLDLRTRQLVDPNDVPVSLTKAEYSLLDAFLHAPQRPLSREYLLHATRMHDDVFDRTIDVRVQRLRRKLEIDPSSPAVIQTQRGVGSVFTPEVEWL
ncbi:MAG: response regulator [Methylocella sp.]